MDKKYFSRRKNGIFITKKDQKPKSRANFSLSSSKGRTLLQEYKHKNGFVTMKFYQKKKNWIFDMDGTLTIAMHNFSEIKRQLGLPEDTDILTSLSRLPPKESLEKHTLLDAIELEIARLANPSPGSFELLQKINLQSNNLGILTRNSFNNSVETLKVTGLFTYFQTDFIFCREHVLPKPDPEGIIRLMELWEANPNDTVMIGDYIYDLEAGKAAGVDTVYIDPEGKFPFKDAATHCIRQLDEILFL